jgi:hypothetical protein
MSEYVQVTLANIVDHVDHVDHGPGSGPRVWSTCPLPGNYWKYLEIRSGPHGPRSNAMYLLPRER